jgi:hypothetical protein
LALSLTIEQPTIGTTTFPFSVKVLYGCANAGRRFVLIPKQLLEFVPRVFLAFIHSFASPPALNHVEVFAEVRHVLFVNEIGAAFAALLGHGFIVVNAVEADLQVRATLFARFEPARTSRQLVFAAAIVAMACHGEKIKLQAPTSKLQRKTPPAKRQAPIPARATFWFLIVWELIWIWVLGCWCFAPLRSPKA